MVKWLKDYLSVGGGNMKVLLVVGTIGVLLVILHVPSVTGAELWTVCYSVDYADATELEPTHRLVRPIPDSPLSLPLALQRLPWCGIRPGVRSSHLDEEQLS